MIATGAGLNEAEAIHESGNDGVLTMTEVWPVEEEDDFAIMEVPRIGGGQSSDPFVRSLVAGIYIDT